MIYAWILGIVFAVLLAAAIIGAIVFFAKEKRVGGTLTIVGALAMFILLLCIPGSFRQVDSGEVAVVKDMGRVTEVRTAGTHFDFWMTKKYERYDAKVQNVEISTQTYSNDAQTMDVQMILQYQLDTASVKNIATTYGSLEVLNNRIQSVAIDTMKSTLAQYKADVIIKTRAEVSPKVTEAVKKNIDGSYYVNVQTVVLTDISFTDAYEAAVEAQMIAEREKEAAEIKAKQEAEVARIKAEAAVKVAEQEVLKAQQEAEARLAQAEGDAKAQKAIAEAEAYAAQIKIVELARALGHEVNEVTDEEGNVTAYKVNWGTGADAEANQQVVLAYLQYLEYLAKWNGELPDVVAGDSGVVIPVTPNSGANKEDA